MAGKVRAGTAYIDVVLGSTEKFFGPLKEKLAGAGDEAARRTGQSFAREFATNKQAYDTLRDGLRKAVTESGLSGEELKKRLGEAGKGGADGFMREFGPLMRSGMLQMSGEMRQKLLEAFDTGTLSPRMVATLRSAFNDVVKEADSAANRTRSAFDRISSAASSAGRAAQSAFTNAHQGLKVFSEGLSQASFKVMNLGYTLSAVLTAPIAALVAVGAGFGIKVAANIEMASAAFETFLGSADKAQAMVKQLRDFANASPLFDTSNVLDFAKRLLAVGVSSDRIMPSMQALQGLAAMYGVTQDKLSNALLGMTQTLAKNKVYMEEIRQVEEAGIPVIAVLAQSLGMTQAQVTEAIKDGKISADQYYEAIVKAGTSGKALGAVEKQAKTLSGVWAQFKETLQSKLADAVEPHLDRIKAGLDRMGTSLGNALKNAGPLFDKVVGGFERLTGGLEKAVNWYDRLSPKQQDFVIKLLGIAAAAGPAAIAAGGLANAISGAAGVFSFLLTPAGLATLAILAIAAGIVYLWNTSPKFREWVKGVIDKARELWHELEPIARSIGDAWDKYMKPALDGVWDVIRNKLLPALGDLKKNFSEEDRQKIVETGRIIRDVLSVAFQIVAFVINNILKPALEWFAEFLKRHKDTIKEWGGMLSDLAKALAVIAAIIFGLVLVAFAVLITIILLVVGAVFGLIIAIAWLGNKWRELTAAGRSAFEGFREGARNALLDVLRMPGQIMSAFSSINLWTIGWNAIMGLIGGLRAALPSALSIARMIGSELLREARASLDSRSPSRKFMALGRDVVAGLAIGMSDSGPAIRSARALASSTIVPFGSPALAGAGSGGIVPASNYVVVKVGEKTVDDLVVESSRRRREDIAAAVEIGNNRLSRRK